MKRYVEGENPIPEQARALEFNRSSKRSRAADGGGKEKQRSGDSAHHGSK